MPRKTFQLFPNVSGQTGAPIASQGPLKTKSICQMERYHVPKRRNCQRLGCRFWYFGPLARLCLKWSQHFWKMQMKQLRSWLTLHITKMLWASPALKPASRLPTARFNKSQAFCKVTAWTFPTFSHALPLNKARPPILGLSLYYTCSGSDDLFVNQNQWLSSDLHFFKLLATKGKR